MHAYIVELHNRPGELARLADALGDRGVNITAIAAVTSGNAGGVALMTDDDKGTHDAMESARIPVHEIAVVSVTLENRPGSLAGVVRKLAESGVNVELLLGTEMTGDSVTVAIGVDNVEAAEGVLGQGAGDRA